MLETFRGTVLTRDGLASGLTHLDRKLLRSLTWASIGDADLPARGCLIGSWNEEAGDPLPELLVVRDEDHADTLAWLASYFGALAPLTQWCRILSRSQVKQIVHQAERVSLKRRLAVWVGATLAECSLQAGGTVNLKELAGSAALSSATFAAGRATAVWGEGIAYSDLAKRHDELSKSLRDGGRPVSAEQLSTIWQILSGNIDLNKNADRRAMEPISVLFDRAVAYDHQAEAIDTGRLTLGELVDPQTTQDLADCARGPQVERVRALDRLADHLTQGPLSPAIDGLLGFGASLIDPGASVLPDLLRKHALRLPLAPIWLGAFAGAWSPVRVLTEQQGLGRLIAKALLAPTDLQGRPSCDVAYEELSRWLTPGRTGQRLDLRGMSPRILSVEIIPGVTCPFAYGRLEPASQPVTVPRGEPTKSATIDQRPYAQRSAIETDALITRILQRVDRLEQMISGQQPSLDMPDPRVAKPKRMGRDNYPKR